jgi:hypothetical protein
LVDTFEVPLQDRFQVTEEGASECLIYSHEHAESRNPGRLQPSAKLCVISTLRRNYPAAPVASAFLR